jgi:AraC-like DNA-binding protein
VERIGRAMRQDGSAQPLQGLHLYRHSFPLEQVYSVVEPSLCVVAQRSAEAPVLLPLITREIIYRLLLGKQGTRLRHLAIQGGYASHIARAIERLRRDFDQPLGIESLARELGMSVSGLHHHFKAVTALSPLQFQKRLRLQEARRLMLGEDLDAASAAYRVGYRDASHFNREYKSLFGVPPMRDMQRLREAAQDRAGR